MVPLIRGLFALPTEQQVRAALKVVDVTHRERNPPMSEHLGRDSRDPTTLSSDELPAAVISALRQGNKIEAIKLLRQARGGDLKTSKDTVDAYLRAQPALRERLVTARAEKSQSYLIWVILLLTLSIAAYLFLKGE